MIIPLVLEEEVQRRELLITVLIDEMERLKRKAREYYIRKAKKEIGKRLCTLNVER